MNLTTAQWNADSTLIFLKHCKQELKDAKHKLKFAQTFVEALETEAKIKFWKNALEKTDLKLHSLFKSPEFSIEPFLNFLPKFKPMEAPEYEEIKSRYQNIIQKITDLETVIHKTFCPVKLAFFNTDMRLLIAEKNEILTFLIEQKP
jgi:hypothetical protein